MNNMRVALLLLFSAQALGFNVPAAKVSTLTALDAVSTGNNFPKGDWEGYSLHKREDTVPQTSTSRGRAKDDVIIDPNFSLAAAVFALGPLIMWYHPSYALDGSPSLIGVCGGAFHMLFAALLWVQTLRVRCVFENDAFEFYNIKGPGLDLDNGAWLEEKPANYVAATRNRWKYDKIINYGFFPSEEFPVIVYFKETETPEWKWNRWFAAFDSYGGGQPHFFPGICSVKQFKEQMELRGAKRKPVPTLKNNRGN